MFIRKITHTTNELSVFLIRLMVGAVFLSEGLQKFIIPEKVGAVRFVKIGLPAPEFLASLVGSFEIICGLFILLGFFTRLAALPLLIIMCVALITTKVPLFAADGFWAGMHASRTDWAMLLGNIFLVIKGGGRWSLDLKLFNT